MKKMVKGKQIYVSLMAVVMLLSLVLLPVQEVQAASWSKTLTKTIKNKKNNIQNIRYIFEVKDDCEVTVYMNGKDEDICYMGFLLFKGKVSLKDDPSKWVEPKSEKDIYCKGRKKVYKLKKGTYTIVHACWNFNKARNVSIKVKTKGNNLKFLKFYNNFEKTPDLPDDANM